MDENNENENFENEENKVTESLYIEPKKKCHKNIKSFVFGLIGGIAGTAIIMGVIFGVPGIRNRLLSLNSNNKETSQIGEKQEVTALDYIEYENPVIAIAEKVSPSIVGIVTEYDYYSFFGTQKATQEGSGIIISSDGYILTNNHVVSSDYSDELNIKVYLQNEKEGIKAELVAKDKQTDMAVLKIDKTDLPAIEYGHSSDCKVGELVVAIGNPLGMNFAGSVSVGYISALDRKLSDSTGITLNLIQTDAAINSGNSGGALVNSKGQLIGINTAKIQGTGIEGMGFAIPIDDVKDVIESLITNKKVDRPYIGIEGRAVDEKTAKSRDLAVGVYIKSVEEFSAAEKAGIKVGDVITEIEGTKIGTVEELNEVKNKYKVGDTIKLKIYRDGKTQEISVKLQSSN